MTWTDYVDHLCCFVFCLNEVLKKKEKIVVMSSRIANNADFLRLLLQTHLPQQRALMSSLSQDQVDLLSEVIFNLLNVVPLPDKSRKALKRKKFLVFISQLKRAVGGRRKKIQAKQQPIIKILLEYRHKLEQVINAN